MLFATRTNRRRGATSVEFAIVGMVFFTFLLALVEFGRGLMVSYALGNAARQGARAGIPDGSTTADVTVAANAALARSTVTGATVTVTPAEVSAAKAGDEITVTVTAPTASVTWFPGARYLVGTLKGSYSLCRE